MNGGIGNGDNDTDVDDDVESNEGSEDTVILSEDVADVDDIGDISAQINVEKLVAMVESGDLNAEDKKQVRQRIDEIEEQRRIQEELGSTYNFNLDDELK